MTHRRKHQKRIDNPNAKCPRAGGRRAKEIQPILDAAWDQGFWIDDVAHGFKLYHPERGRQPRDRFDLPGTPSGRRDNYIADARRAGVDL